MVCGNEYKAISRTHLGRHRMTMNDYIAMFPGAKTVWNSGLQPSPEELKKRKETRNEYLREYHQKNKDRINARRKAWRQRPEVKAREKAYRQRPEVKLRERERQKRFREKNLEHYRDYHKQWYERNRERLRELSHDYRSRPEVRERQRRITLLKKYGESSLAVLERDNYTCQKCGSKKQLHIHRIDWNEENNTPENLILLCNSCHQKVHSFIPVRLRKPIFDEWIKEIT